VSKTSKAAVPMEGEEKDDLAALIYRESQLRKAEKAAAAAAKSKKSSSASSRRRTSTRKRPASHIDGKLTKDATRNTSSKRKWSSPSMEEEDKPVKKVGRDGRCRKIILCSVDGCTNRVVKEECALSMGQRSDYAALKVVQIKLRKEECALGMGQRSSYAAVKVARTMQSKEECA